MCQIFMLQNPKQKSKNKIVHAELSQLVYLPLLTIEYSTFQQSIFHSIKASPTPLIKYSHSVQIQSRVGDRPTATILHAQFHFLTFAWVFKSKYLIKTYPSQKDHLYIKMQGRRSRPSKLSYIYPFQEGYILVKYFALKTIAKIKK